ncbi:MAG: DUF308 domain-containing protein, partial [Actinomycetes bacterium]
ASWRAEPDAPRWPVEEYGSEQHNAEHHPDGEAPPLRPRKPDEGNEDHFEPPEPPPLPVPTPRTLGGLLLLGAGVLLLIQPSMLSLSEGVGFSLGLLAITAGIGWLILGLRGGPPPEGWDDGARL